MRAAAAATATKLVPGSMVRDLVESTQEVFQTMLFQEAEPRPPHEAVVGQPKADVIATVALTGPADAVVAIYGSVETARSLAASMLGLDAAEINDEFADAMGELANMIGGTFRNRMTAIDSSWAISVPTVTIGTGIVTRYPTDVGRIVCPFGTQGGEINIELVLRA
jgi:chemotaxis protein CheX